MANMMMTKTFFTAFIAIFVSLASFASARDQIRIVGSSTVYPFVTVVAEQFGRKTDFKTPIVESTGTGGGFKFFCDGIGEGYPDITNASRRIKPTELVNCYKNDVLDISEIKFGYDGIVLANSSASKKYNLKLKEIFLALAKKVPSKSDASKLVDNYYKTWDEINPALPNVKIQVYGPPPTSGTRDAFAELVMEAGCWKVKAYEKKYPDLKDRKKSCHLIREDGIYIDSGENDNLIVQKLNTNKDALGIFGFSFLDENKSLVQGSKIENVAPTHETIGDNSYVISRPLFVYVKNDHIGTIPGIKEFMTELVSDDAIAPFGYLEERGLIPLPEDKIKKMQDDVAKGTKLENLAE